MITFEWKCCTRQWKVKVKAKLTKTTSEPCETWNCIARKLLTLNTHQLMSQFLHSKLLKCLFPPGQQLVLKTKIVLICKRCAGGDRGELWLLGRKVAGHTRRKNRAREYHWRGLKWRSPVGNNGPHGRTTDTNRFAQVVHTSDLREVTNFLVFWIFFQVQTEFTRDPDL